MVKLRGFVENNLYIVAGVALGVAVAQLLGIKFVFYIITYLENI